MKQEQQKTQETKEVANILNAGLPAEALTKAVANQDVISSDVLLPRLLLKQPISEDVVGGQFKPGDVVRSTTGEVVASPANKDGFNLIPLRMDNSWVNYEIVKGKEEYRSTEARSAYNEQDPWEYMKNGTQWKRKKAVTLYGILPTDVEGYRTEIAKAQAGEVFDMNKTLMPVAITFQATSFKDGAKPIATFFNSLKANAKLIPGIAPYMYMLPVTCESQKNDKGTYFVFSVGQTKPVPNFKGTDEAAVFLRETVQSWYSILSQAKDIAVEGAAVEQSGSSAESTLV